jgi:hypothetical protein
MGARDVHAGCNGPMQRVVRRRSPRQSRRPPAPGLSRSCTPSVRSSGSYRPCGTAGRVRARRRSQRRRNGSRPSGVGQTRAGWRARRVAPGAQPHGFWRRRGKPKRRWSSAKRPWGGVRPRGILRRASQRRRNATRRGHGCKVTAGSQPTGGCALRGRGVMGSAGMSHGARPAPSRGDATPWSHWGAGSGARSRPRVTPVCSGVRGWRWPACFGVALAPLGKRGMSKWRSCGVTRCAPGVPSKAARVGCGGLRGGSVTCVRRGWSSRACRGMVGFVARASARDAVHTNGLG